MATEQHPGSGLETELEDAFERIRLHTQRASLEGLAAAGAALDVLRLLGGGEGVFERLQVPADLMALIDEWIQGLEQERLEGQPTGWADPLLAAIQAEIDRWEETARSDPAARPVHLTFVGLRRLLEEIGVRPGPGASHPPGRKAGRRSEPKPKSGPEPKAKRQGP